MALSDTDKNQLRVVAGRMFAFGTEGRVFCRPLLAETGKTDGTGDYRGVKADLLEIISTLWDDLYTSPPPRMSS